MLSQDEVQHVIGTDAYTSDGERIGKVGQIFLDDQTGEPVFATVNTGMFGTNENFVPMTNASVDDGRLVVGFDSDRVKGAPNVSPDDGHLSPEDEQALYDYYGVPYASEHDDTDSDDNLDSAAGTGERLEGDDAAMTRSEEKLRVGKAREVTGRARLRKYVVTEDVTITVPVRKEKAVLEAVPVGEEDSGGDYGEVIEGAQLEEGSPEIVLSEEVPVVEKTVQPVERVRLGKEQVVEMETVTEEVRQERISAEGDIIDRDHDTDNTTTER